MSEGAEPRFIQLTTVYWLHRRSLEVYGGLDGVRDPGAIESALASAQNAYVYGGGDVYDIAAAYAFHLAEAQAFIDGNKRVAAACALTFLAGSGVRVPADADDALYAAMIGLAEHKQDKAGLAAWLRSQFPRSTSAYE